MSEATVEKFRICPFCEATCGLAIEMRGGDVVAVRGDSADVFSHGFVCPKGAAIADLDADPDRLRQPLLRRNGKHVEVEWEEAFAEVERRLPPIIAAGGADAVGVYLGNPSAHKIDLTLYGQVLLKSLRSRNVFSASTVDQIPKQLASGWMYGGFLSIAVPDIDRTDFLLVLGANPYRSTGRRWTLPDCPGRLRRLRERGGRCVVVDPRRTRTARAADEHVFLRPATDVFLLAAILHVLQRDGLVAPGRLAEQCNGLDELDGLFEAFAPERVAGICGVAPETIERLARDLAAAEHAVVYARIGTCTQRYGTTVSWLVDLCNLLTGNLDRDGGAMFPCASAFAANTRGRPGVGRGIRTGRRLSRVRKAPEVMGELPVACLAEEIETPGDGQIRALITVAGNPVLSTPNGERLDRALASLDFMVSLDIYLNETTRHADVIFPGLSVLEEAHFDVAFPQLAYRNAARYSPPLRTPPADRPHEWHTLLRLAAIVSGQGAGADVAALDDFVVASQVQGAVADEYGPLYGRDAAEIMAALGERRGPARMIDFALRSGPYGDGFGSDADGLSLDALEAHPHGIDLGALAPRLPALLRTPSGRIEAAPEALVADLERARDELAAGREDGLRMIGRRHLRSNNSWMHNLPRLAGGRARCTLLVHPDDARRLGLHDGGAAVVRSRVGAVEAQVEVSDEIMPGVVSLPHGWGHGREGTRMGLAAREPGVNSNALADELDLDPLSGNGVLNGIPVEVFAA